MTKLRGVPDCPYGTPLTVTLILPGEGYQGGARGLLPKLLTLNYHWASGTYRKPGATVEAEFGWPRQNADDAALKGAATAVADIGTGPGSQRVRYALSPVETAPGFLDLNRDPEAVAVIPSTDLYQAVEDIKGGAQTLADTRATLAQVQQTAASAQSLADSGRRLATATAGRVNRIKGYRDGVLPDGSPPVQDRLIGAYLAWFPTPEGFPVPRSLLPVIYFLNATDVSSSGTLQYGFTFLAADGPYPAGMPIRIGQWLSRSDLSSMGAGARFDCQILWYNAQNTLIADAQSYQFSPADLAQVGRFEQGNGIAGLVSTVEGVGGPPETHLTHLLFAEEAPPGAAYWFLHFRVRGATNVSSGLALAKPTVLWGLARDVDALTVYPETPQEAEAMTRPDRAIADLREQVEALGQGGGSTGGALLPRYTGGSVNCLVFLDVVNGVNTWVDADPTIHKDKLYLPKAIISPDGTKALRPEGVLSLTGLPANSPIMLVKAPAPGQSNLAAQPSPLPANRRPSATFTFMHVGQTAVDPTQLFVELEGPLFEKAPLGVIAEYPFLGGGNDVSGNGRNATVTAGTYNGLGLVMDGVNTRVDTPIPMSPALSVVVSLRRADNAAEHAVMSGAAMLYRINTNDSQAIWADTGSPRLDFGPAPALNTTYTVCVTFNGSMVHVYDQNNVLITSKADFATPVGMSGTLTFGAGPFASPFRGVLMRAAAYAPLSDADRATALQNAVAAVSGRSA